MGYFFHATGIISKHLSLLEKKSFMDSVFCSLNIGLAFFFS